MFTIPTECPVCGAKLEIRKDHTTKTLVCPNINCSAQRQGKFEQILGKKGLDVEGLSTQTIKDLIDWGWLNTIKDVFELSKHRDEWKTKKGYGDNVDKLIANINPNVPLWKVFIIACIPNIGKQNAKLLANHFKTWENFRKATADDLVRIEGIGLKMVRTLLDFDYTEIEEAIKCYLIIEEKESTNAKLDGKNFCITGKLSMKRDDLVAIIEANGGAFGGVSKKTDYLICNDKTSNSGKSKKAKDLGVPIITEEEFHAMLA